MKIYSLGIFLTRKCNFSCIYCCSETGADPSDKMTLEEIKDTILQAKGLGAREIVIPGEGEPVLDKNLFPIIDFASKNSLNVTVFTNGSLIDRELAYRFYKHKVSIVFKLHALDKVNFDLLAGKENATAWADYMICAGSETGRNIPKGLINLMDAGYSKTPKRPFFKPLLEIETVVVKQNLKHVPEVAFFCREIGVDCMVETLIRTNNAAVKTSSLCVTAEEENRLYQKLCSILGWRFRFRQKVRCRFETNPFLDVSGNIRHCFSLPCEAGNIRDFSLAELHGREMNIRKKREMLNKKISFDCHGFRVCASRKSIEMG